MTFWNPSSILPNEKVKRERAYIDEEEVMAVTSIFFEIRERERGTPIAGSILPPYSGDLTESWKMEMVLVKRI